MILKETQKPILMPPLQKADLPKMMCATGLCCEKLGSLGLAISFKFDHFDFNLCKDLLVDY